MPALRSTTDGSCRTAAASSTSSAGETPSPPPELRPTTRSPAYISPACSSGRTSPVTDGLLVGILVGSESDRERMEGAKTARERALLVLICGAGLAAALPGAVAAHTDLPVIGVPLRSSLSVLDGLDALLAIAQMPPGVPVAAVGVDNARNAAALAVRILRSGSSAERVF